MFSNSGINLERSGGRSNFAIPDSNEGEPPRKGGCTFDTSAAAESKNCHTLVSSAGGTLFGADDFLLNEK